MQDINKSKYSHRREYRYDDDTAVLFYQGNKIAKGPFEMFRDNWIEESYNLEDRSVKTLFEDLGYNTIDVNESYEDIFDKLDWDPKSKSFKYNDWELIVLEI